MFEIDADLLSGRTVDAFIMTEEPSWRASLERGLPAGASLAAMGWSATAHRYMVDVAGAPRLYEQVTSAVRLTVSPWSSGFSTFEF